MQSERGDGVERGMNKVCLRAFSLIELLVTISVIAVVLGILLPTIPAVMDNGRRAACTSNLRQIGTGVALHLSDNQDRFPVARYMPEPWLSGDTDPPFNDAIGTYIERDSPVYMCPGDDVVFGYEFTDEEGRLRTCPSSYSYQSGLSGLRYEDTFFYRFLNRSPDRTAVMTDYDGGTFETQDGTTVRVDFFHSRRGVLFADLHAGPAPSGTEQ